MKDVAVLGCGPTGLLVAYAVKQAGHQPHIISKKVKSVIPGAQHLHGPVPGLTPHYPEGTIKFIRLGTEEGYAKKVYGDPDRNTGWSNYLQEYPSWNVQRAYNLLWEIFERDIDDEEINGKDGMRIFQLTLDHDMVISTIPAQSLCYQDHEFKGTLYYIRKMPTPPADAEHEIFVYNGLADDAWYRWSILGGQCTIEYATPPYPTEENGWRQENWITGTKAHSHNCDCHPKVIRLGRWAEWRHGKTMHGSYLRAVELMDELGEGMQP